MACASSDYYDVMLVGKTGRGKSTLGNKLLQVKTTEPAAIKNYECGATAAAESHLAQLCPRWAQGFFTASDFSDKDKKKRMTSVTQDCQLMSNENTMMRVMDTPGFADSGNLSQGRSVYDGNLFIFRKILREQVNPRNRLMVRRIVYFLPERGVLEKAAGDLQDELKVMHYFYGDAIFNCMVVIATNPPKNKRIQDAGMDKEELQEIEEVFQIAMELAVPGISIFPPIVYMGLNDTDIEALAKIKGAEVPKDEVFTAEFRDDICSRCGVKFLFDSTRKDKRISIINPATNELHPYEGSKCHPYFVQRFSTTEKFFGGLAHIATLGAGLLYSEITGEESWPGFTNSEEICPKCECSPGSKGCCVVEETTYKDAAVDHTSRL